MSRRRRERFAPRKVKDTEALISFILERHSVGLLVLCGDEEWPTTADFADMSREYGIEPNSRVQGGEEVPNAQRMLERADFFERATKNAGGKDRIIEIFRALRATDNTEWKILRDSSQIRRGRPYFTGDFTARTIARRHHIHEDTLRRNRLIIIQRLAFEICYPGLEYLKRVRDIAI